MHVRLALESDVDAIVEMSRSNIEQTRPTLEFDEERCRATIRSYFDTASPTIFVAVDDTGPIGYLGGEFYEYRAASGIFTVQEVLYVVPEKRGTRAATILMKQLVAWSQMLGAKEIIGGNDNGFNSERTAKFLEHFGFERVGYSMRRAL